MTRRSLLPLFALLPALVLVATAADPKPADPAPKVTVKPLPPDPEVPSKVDLPAKDFTEKLEGTILVPSDEDDKKMVEVPLKATLEMVYIPGGEFLMGSPDGEAGREDHEGPRFKVTVRPFWMAKVETTWDQFDIWWKNASLPNRIEVEPKNSQVKVKPDAITRPTNPYVDETYKHGRPNKPAICMSHHSAMMFCHWLRLTTKKPYRLPTEAEWEYACRAGSTGAYSFDDKTDKLDDYAWYAKNAPTKTKKDGTTHDVGTKKPNTFGLFDMHGNVSEWVLDQYDPKRYAKFPADKLTLCPVNLPTEKKWSHPVRGGSWSDAADKLRSACRIPSEADWMSEDPQFPRSIWWLTERDAIGFRVCLPTDEYPELVGLKPRMLKKGQ